jgi:hypothetical protein
VQEEKLRLDSKMIFFNRLSKTLFFTAFFLLLIANEVKAHEFYVSLINITYQKDYKSIEIEIKIFSDDLELAIENFSGSKQLFIGTEKEVSNIDEFIKPYILNKFSVDIGKKGELVYLGSETENDAKWIYLEIPNIAEPKQIEVFCSFLVEVLPSQKNIIQLNLAGKRKGFILDKKKNSFSYSVK